jgi:hypothetical protein
MANLKAMAINLAIILLFMNAAPNLMVASGVTDDWGVTPAVGGDAQVGQANSAMQNIEPTGGFASTLFQLYSSVTGPVRAVMGLVVGGPIILASIGIPSWVITFVFAPQYLIVGGTIIYVLAGRRL